MLVLFGEGIVDTFALGGSGIGEEFAHTFTVLQLRLDEGREHRRIERFRDISISPDIETLHLILGSHLRRDEDDGDMTKLDILFDLLTKLIAILSRHGHIAEHNIRFFGTHLLKSRLCIETSDEPVVLREQQAHVVDDLRIVVDYEDCRTVILRLL